MLQLVAPVVVYDWSNSPPIPHLTVPECATGNKLTGVDVLAFH